ncbi:MAG: SsrA-binding protein SmpB [Bacteroidota bacterium]
MSQKKNKDRFSKNVFIKNRKASFEYELIDRYTAGIELKGTEIKSIREGKVSLPESYCYFRNEELFIKQMTISPYSNATHFNHEAQRDRKLLLNKKELQKLKSGEEEKGMSIIPTSLFINDNGIAKLNIALAKGKKLYDKREDIKKKDTKREIERMKL